MKLVRAGRADAIGKLNRRLERLQSDRLTLLSLSQNTVSSGGKLSQPCGHVMHPASLNLRVCHPGPGRPEREAGLAAT